MRRGGVDVFVIYGGRPGKVIDIADVPVCAILKGRPLYESGKVRFENHIFVVERSKSLKDPWDNKVTWITGLKP
jgi:hypothetical protein